VGAHSRRPLIFIAAALVLLIGFAALLFIAYAVRRFSYYQTSAFAMSPNINPGDLFIVDRFAYDASRGPHAGDVIAFSGPTFSTAPGAPFTPGVKRVVAGPGDLVTISGGVLLLNGKPAAEPPLGSRAPYRLEIRDFSIFVDGRRLDDARHLVFMPPADRWKAPNRVPSGCYLILGDNRARSMDSHIVGFLCPGLPTTVDGVVPSIVGRVLMPPFWHVEPDHTL
jgi:signal peptidase I